MQWNEGQGLVTRAGSLGFSLNTRAAQHAYAEWEKNAKKCTISERLDAMHSIPLDQQMLSKSINCAVSHKAVVCLKPRLILSDQSVLP